VQRGKILTEFYPERAEGFEMTKQLFGCHSEHGARNLSQVQSYGGQK
jgi:hypothetical protein